MKIIIHWKDKTTEEVTLTGMLLSTRINYALDKIMMRSKDFDKLVIRRDTPCQSK